MVGEGEITVLSFSFSCLEYRLGESIDDESYLSSMLVIYMYSIDSKIYQFYT